MMQQPAAGGVAPPPSMAADQSQTQQYQQQPQPWMMMSQQQQQAGQPVPPPSGWNPQPPWMDENYLISIFVHTGESYNGVPMPNAEQNFRLNWAALGYGEKKQEEGLDYTIFVGDLAADVTDYMLKETFKVVYPSVKGAKVVTDRTTGRSKGYGFVRFGDETEQIRAMTEMNGIYCSTRAMRIGPASNKKPITSQQYQKGHQEAIILGGLELISAEMIPL
ncbi:hypothetical protein PTKIN_Ptkin11bG0177700 [Pterospermum kingtungense]